MQARGSWTLDQISDERLVGSLKELLAGEGRSEARIVAHLAEVDTRRLHLKGARSLFEYCQETLGLSDNQSYYRIAAARVARRFPVVFELLEHREIHLTNIAPISKHLTEENHRELLREAGRLSKRELLKMLARRAPLPAVPSNIRKLVPAPGAVSAGPTGSLQALSGSTYRLQLNTSEALKQKLELARDLMSHANPSGDLAVVVERALDSLLERLESRRFGQTSRPRPKSEESPQTPPPRHPTPDSLPVATEGQIDKLRVPGVEADATAGRAGGAQSEDDNGVPHFDRSKRRRLDAARQPSTSEEAQACSEPAPSRAHIANHTRRQVLERDGLRCSYVASDGRRCSARAFLQIHHELPWAKGGSDSFDNLHVLCQAHNQLLAEREYGAGRVAAAIERRRGRGQRA